MQTTLQQIHFPATGILRTAMDRTADAAKVAAAVAAIARGVERRGINASDTGISMNMCMRYIP